MWRRRVSVTLGVGRRRQEVVCCFNIFPTFPAAEFGFDISYSIIILFIDDCRKQLYVVAHKNEIVQKRQKKKKNTRIISNYWAKKRTLTVLYTRCIYVLRKKRKCPLIILSVYIIGWIRFTFDDSRWYFFRPGDKSVNSNLSGYAIITYFVCQPWVSVCPRRIPEYVTVAH